VRQEWTCKGCGERTSSKGGIEQENGVHFVVCVKCGAKNKIAQTGGGAGSPMQFTIVSLIPVRVIYSTSAKFELGQMHEASFPNLEKAKSAALPGGYSFALIDTDEGRYVYAPSHGWQLER
jgi:hypothetical protein